MRCTRSVHVEAWRACSRAHVATSIQASISRWGHSIMNSGRTSTSLVLARMHASTRCAFPHAPSTRDGSPCAQRRTRNSRTPCTAAWSTGSLASTFCARDVSTPCTMPSSSLYVRHARATPAGSAGSARHNAACIDMEAKEERCAASTSARPMPRRRRLRRPTMLGSFFRTATAHRDVGVVQGTSLRVSEVHIF